MVTKYYEKDGDLSLLKGKTIAIIGYGSQGHAHALNLRDSGLDSIVGLPETSKSTAKAVAAGLRVLSVADAAKAAEIIMMLVPDHIQGELYKKDIEPHLTAGKTLMFAHGFNIHFGFITPPKNIDVSMIAPKAPGHRVREVFIEGQGVPGLVAIHQDCLGECAQECAGLWRRHRMPARRDSRNLLQGRNRNRPFRRTGGPLRRRQRVDPRRIPNPGRCRIRPGNGLFRVPARSEADCRSDL